MKKFKLLFILAPLFMASSCSTKWNFKSSAFLKKDKNVYEVTFTDYNLDYALQSRKEVITNLKPLRGIPGGCSAAASISEDGAFVGRNLDLPFGHFADVIVYVPKNDDRYASVASFNAMQIFTKDKIEPKEMNQILYHLIPISVCDGINENGVVCEMNVVPCKDITPTTSTNKKGKKLNIGNVVRFVLDNASSAAHAINLLRGMDLCCPWDWSGAQGKGWEYHYLIADKHESYVVEIVNNEMRVLKENVLSNYYLSIPEGTPHGMGIERYTTLKDNLDDVTSAKTMGDLMEKSYWTKSNFIEGETTEESFCYSDHFGTIAKDGTEITKFNYHQYEKELIENGKNDANLTKEMIESESGENKYGLWITLHTCIFDIKELKMHFIVHEKTKGYEEAEYDFSVPNE